MKIEISYTLEQQEDAARKIQSRFRGFGVRRAREAVGALTNGAEESARGWEGAVAQGNVRQQVGVEARAGSDGLGVGPHSIEPFV